MERRHLLLGGAATLATASLYGCHPLSSADLDLVPRPGVAGFLTPRARLLARPRMAAALAGVNSAPAFTGDLNAALFPEQGGAQVAVFTDYRCPECRRFAARTLELALDPDVAISFHDWPILGPASVQGAKAARAAARQGRNAYLAMHERLMETSFVPNHAWVKASAEALGLDVARLLIDMAAPEVDVELARTNALAYRMAFRGTPSIVIGDVAVHGAPSDRMLAALLERARAA